MKLWKRAAGALKDKHSIWSAKFSGQRPFRNPDLERVIIKATSHDENRIDCKNVQRVFQWLRTSPLYLKPLLIALSMRMQKTRSWIVALKGLMLIHGVFCCNIPAIQKLGRLPFDFSNFSDGHVHPGKAWGFNAFVRAYFAYLDQRSAFVSSEVKKNNISNHVGMKKNTKDVVVVEVEETLTEELDKLQKLQSMIDMLLHIKPRNNLNMNHGLILEAMDCVIVEVFDVYSKFCKRIARVLLRIYDVGGKVEAGIALKVLQKAMAQGDELSFYFEYCRDIGVLNASQCPKIERISEEDIQDLETIIGSGGASDAKKKSLEFLDGGNGVAAVGNNEDKAIVLSDCYAATVKNSQEKGLTTVITHQWEVFDDDDIFGGGGGGGVKGNDVFNIGAMAIVKTSTNPFEESYNYSLVPCHPVVHNNQVVLPDLISF